MLDELDLALLRADILGRQLPRELRAAAARIADTAPPELRRALHETVCMELAVAVARAEVAFARHALAAAQLWGGPQ